MKRIILILPTLLLLIVACDEDAASPDDTCVELTTSYSDATAEFGSDVTLANCEAQYAALGAWCDGDCEPSDTAEEDAICPNMTDLDSDSITATCELLLDITDEDGSSDSDDEDGSSDSDDEDGDDAPPACASDCDGYDSMIGEDETDDYDVWCGWLSTWSTEGCLSDCTADELEDADILLLVEVCTECLENDNCEEVIDGEEEDGDDDDDSDDGDESDDGDDDFPECLLDCGDLGNLAGDPVDVGQDVYCNELAAFDDSCLSDCDDDFIAFFNIQIIQCEACLENDNCECYFVDESPEGCDDDDSDDGDESDDGDDDFPECFLDCDMSIFLSPTATCEFFGGDDISCTDDCTGDDALMVTLWPIMCGTCVEDGDCDDIGGGDDDDDEDGDDEDGDGPPDCYLDCPEVQPLSDFMDYGIGDMTSDEVCEIFLSWDGDTCLDDCPSEDLEFIEPLVPLCSACLDAGNCDDLFSEFSDDDDGDDDDGDDEDDDDDESDDGE